MNKIKNLLFAGLLCFALTGCSTPVINEIVNSETKTEVSFDETNDNIIYESSDNHIVSSDADLHIYVLDVGQGSACLIQSNGKSMLIDAGENSCEDLIVNYLHEFNVQHLDYLIGTHPDSDHVGGLDAVIDNFDIDNVFLSAITDKDTKTCKDVLASLDAKGLTYSTPAVGETYNLGNASFIVLAPSNHYEDANNNSIAIKLTYGEFDFLTTGDCEKEAERDLCSLDYDLTAEVYNAGHHGSSNASSEELLDRVQPSAVTISCGADNKYKHPHDATMKRFADRNISTYRTDELGTIEIVSDGISFNINGIIVESKEYEVVPSLNDDNDIVFEEDTNAQEFEETTMVTETPIETIVWITNTGTKYHRENCDSLSNSKIETTLEEAIAKGLEPCKKCNP